MCGLIEKNTKNIHLIESMKTFVDLQDDYAFVALIG